MRKHGYLTQPQLGGPASDEVQLYVTREGRFCKKGGGNHRILMAEVLEMRQIPVSVAGVHPLWVHWLTRTGQRPLRAVADWIAKDPRLHVPPI